MRVDKEPVARPRSNPKGARVSIHATIDHDLNDWVEKTLRTSNVYANKSHLVERAITLLKKSHKE